MAQIALQLPVFVSSSSDVMPARDYAHDEICRASREASDHNLFLYPFLWERDHFASSGHPQPLLTEEMKQAEKVIVIISARIGPGTRQELFESLDLARRGIIDNVAIYFLRPESGWDSAAKEVHEVRRQIELQNLALTHECGSIDEFRQTLRRHLDNWIKRWYGVRNCCVYALKRGAQIHGTQHTGESRILTLSRIYDRDSLRELAPALGELAVRVYQACGPQGAFEPIPRDYVQSADRNWRQALSRQAECTDPVSQIRSAEAGALRPGPTPLRMDSADAIRFADFEWFSYFCAIGLVAAICERRLDAVARHPYLNSIHQYLSVLAAERLAESAPVLREWLRNDKGVTTHEPVVRNFAAYVLGMIGAIDAQDDLAEALRRDRGEDVGTYCITSLGKLRARRYLPLLVERFHDESDRMKVLIGEAVCRIIGIEEFEL